MSFIYFYFNILLQRQRKLHENATEIANREVDLKIQ